MNNEVGGATFFFELPVGEANENQQEDEDKEETQQADPRKHLLARTRRQVPDHADGHEPHASLCQAKGINQYGRQRLHQYDPYREGGSVINRLHHEYNGNIRSRRFRISPSFQHPFQTNQRDAAIAIQAAGKGNIEIHFYNIYNCASNTM